MPEIDWNSENTRVLCMLFAEQVGKGNRPNTHLNALGYTEVEKGFKEKTRIVVTKVQIKNKWDKLKEDFKAWKKLMLRQTGTGWDPIKKTIAMDDEWWKKARAVSWFKIFAIFVLHMTKSGLWNSYNNTCCSAYFRTFRVVESLKRRALRMKMN